MGRPKNPMKEPVAAPVEAVPLHPESVLEPEIPGLPRVRVHGGEIFIQYLVKPGGPNPDDYSRELYAGRLFGDRGGWQAVCAGRCSRDGVEREVAIKWAVKNYYREQKRSYRGEMNI